jgi:hypothetical protein
LRNFFVFQKLNTKASSSVVDPDPELFAGSGSGINSSTNAGSY